VSNPRLLVTIRRRRSLTEINMNRQPHFISDPLSTSAGRSVGRIFRNLSGSLVLFASLVLTVSAATSQGPSGYWHEARSIAALDLRLASLEGMVYEPSTGAFLIFGESVSSAGGAGALPG